MKSIQVKQKESSQTVYASPLGQILGCSAQTDKWKDLKVLVIVMEVSDMKRVNIRHGRKERDFGHEYNHVYRRKLVSYC